MLCSLVLITPPSISTQLTHALHAAPGDWPAKIASHTRNLMRMNTYPNFESILAQVLADIKADTVIQKEKARAAAQEAKNGVVKIRLGNGAGGRESGLALPAAVVEEGIAATKKALEEICIVDE